MVGQESHDGRNVKAACIQDKGKKKSGSKGVALLVNFLRREKPPDHGTGRKKAVVIEKTQICGGGGKRINSEAVKAQ